MSEQNSVDEQSKNQSLENYRTAPGERLTLIDGQKSVRIRLKADEE